MVEEPTPNLIAESTELVLHADRAGLQVQAAFWLLEENGEWMLILLSPLINSKGPRYAYTLVQSLLGDTDIRLSDIRIAAPKGDDTYEAIVDAVGAVEPDTGLRLRRNTFNGRFVEDVFVLWSKPKSATLRQGRLNQAKSA